MVTEIAGAGTAERVWRGWLDGAPLPELDLSGAGRPLVVAPHPDDEVLGVGGLLALLAPLAPLAPGGAVDVVAVTDGEGSHPGSSAVRPDTLRRVRPAETARALAELGLGGPAGAVVHRLRHPDGAVDEAALAAALRGLLAPGQWCLATWRGDGHPDHEATGRAAAAACAAAGARLLEFPVWAWHWAVPGDERLPWSSAYRIRLPERVRAAKSAAIGAYRSQIEALGPADADAPVLPPHVLDRFRRPYEVVFG